MKALLLAAGLGSRLKPFTDHHPKALARVNGISLLEYNIRNLQRFGIYDIVVNVHHFAQQIVTVLEQEKGFGSNIEISDESDAVLETGGGLKKATPFLKGEADFLVMNVDILSNFDLDKMKDQHAEAKPLATLAVQKRDSSRYFLFDKTMKLKGWENIQTGEQKIPGGDHQEGLRSFAFSGIQLLNNKILDKINFEGKFSLVDLYLDLCKTEEIRAWNHTGDLLLDVGKPESLKKAEGMFNNIFL